MSQEDKRTITRLVSGSGRKESPKERVARAMWLTVEAYGRAVEEHRARFRERQVRA